jgi:hypothetical protein
MLIFVHKWEVCAMLPIAEYDIISLGHGLCGSGATTPSTIRTPAKSHSLLALSLIHPATGCFEIVKTINESATSIQDLFHNTWSARYPWPQFIVFDNGGEIKREFKQMRDNYGIKAKQTTSHNHINPQANAIIDRMHKFIQQQWHAQIIWLGKQSWKSRRTRR